MRYDGGHKRDPFLMDAFAPHVEWVPVCPEVEVGMGTPREPVHLVAAAGGLRSAEHRVRLVGVQSGRDWTRAMARWCEDRVSELRHADLSGYILKKDSPSCGLQRVRVCVSPRAGSYIRTGRGLFAQALLDAMPNLPIEDEGRLHDPRIRESFVERVFAYQRVRRFFAGRWTVGDLVAFHTAHKLQLLSHSRQAYAVLGRLVARAASLPRRDLAVEYEAAFMTAWQRTATPGRHADVLHHMLGHLKRDLDDDSRRELLGLIEDHRKGLVPLVVPLTLIRHHVRQHRIEYLAGQVYLDPHPRELCLRNHV